MLFDVFTHFWHLLTFSEERERESHVKIAVYRRCTFLLASCFEHFEKKKLNSATLHRTTRTMRYY